MASAHDGDGHTAIVTASNTVANQLLIYSPTGVLQNRISTQGQGGVSGNAGGITDLYILNADGTHFRALTHDVFGDVQPQWSPDGRTIAFATDRDSASCGETSIVDMARSACSANESACGRRPISGRCSTARRTPGRRDVLKGNQA